MGSVFSCSFDLLNEAVDRNMVFLAVADNPQKKKPAPAAWAARTRSPQTLPIPAKHQALTYRGVSSAIAETINPTIRRTMIPNRDIYQIAIVMLERYGASASTYAELEAEKLLDAGDESKFRTWLRILLAMEELQEVPASPILH
jgi:hypothetical protein